MFDGQIWYIMGYYEIEVYKMGGMCQNHFIKRLEWFFEWSTGTEWIDKNQYTW